MTDKNLWQKIAIVSSCIAVGMSGSIGIVNHNANVREDKNTCAIKQFLKLQEDRTRAIDNPGAVGAADSLKDVNMSLHAPCKKK